jgi:hypothetical protein
VDRYPTLSRDESVLYLARNPVDNDEIYMAFRDGVSGPFGLALPVAQVNVGTFNDRPTWASPDGCRLYFVSDRNAVGLPPGSNIWMAERTPD